MRGKWDQRRAVYRCPRWCRLAAQGEKGGTVSASQAAAGAQGRRFRPTFYFWLVLAMVFFVYAGFGMHSALPALRGAFPPAPPVVHLHGVLAANWMLLLLVQTSLVSAGNVALHRSLGLFGIAWGTLVISMGLLMQLVAVNRPDTAQLDPALKAAAARNLAQLRGDQQALEYVKRLRKEFQIKVAEDRL